MLLRTLLPACVLYAEMDPRLAGLTLLHAEEKMQVQSSVEKRQLEYAAGRQLSRSLLGEIGIRDFPLLNGIDRVPRWPDGILGSITHCNSLCAVALGKAGEVMAIGIDVEQAEPLPAEAEALAILPEERLLIKKLPESIQALATRLIFSAKESAYKAIYPETQIFLEFSEVQIELHENGNFFATVLNSKAADIFHKEIRGRYHIDSRHLGTSVVLV
jgi:4'-phosphopantetheinyl transferase EntD